jgi:hypothetical protein
MAAFYTYLISSLPMLHFGIKPPFSWERFLAMCRDLIPQRDWEVLELCGRQSLLEEPIGQPALKKWVDFEIGLRNELVKVRAARKKIEPAKYLRREGYSEIALYHIAIHSHRIPSLIDSEKFLDQERWQKLEDLSLGHYFDLDFLIMYCLKLRILWRWENFTQADKEAQLAQALTGSNKY